MWWYVAVFFVALALLVLSSERWGGRDERRVARMLAAAAIASVVMRRLELGTYFYIAGPQPGVEFIDLLLLIGLVFAALRSGRLWISGEAALQVAAMTGHLAKAMGIPLTGLAYALMAGASSYPALLLLAIGILQTRLRAAEPRAHYVRSSSAAGRAIPRRPRDG